MKRYLFYLLCLVCATIGFAQQYENEIDSLQRQLNIENDTNEKLKIYLMLYDKAYLKFREKDSAFKYIKSAERFINSITKDSITTLIHTSKARYYQNKRKYDSVFYYAELALKHYKKIPSNKLISLFNDVGLSNYHKSNYPKALEYYFNALRVCDSIDSKREKTQILNNVGITYIRLKDWIKAEIYMNECLDLCKQFDIKRGIIYTLGNLGIIYKNQNKFDDAIASYTESISIGEVLNDKTSIARNYLNIGSLHEAKNDFDNALNVYDKGLEIVKDISHHILESRLLLSKANIYSKQKRFYLADTHYNKSLKISNQKDFLDILSEIHLGHANSYEDRGNYKQAIISRKLYETLKDSLINKEHLSSISELEIKYESEKKDKELIAQKFALKQQNIKIQRQQSQTKLMIGLTVFLLLISILSWFLYSQNRKRKDQEILSLKREQQIKTLESLMEGEEKERLRIAQELHDGVNVDLSAIKYKLTSLLEKNNQVINEAVSMIDKSCKQVRAISHNLVPPALKNFSLVEAIEDYCSTSNAIHNIHIRFQHLGNAIALSKKAEVNIFRIVQELVNNSIKHAEATEIDVQISHQDDSIQLTIEDNGKGFDINQEGNNGIGLQNVYSRIKYLNAKLDVTSDNKGTSYVIDIDAKEII